MSATRPDWAKNLRIYVIDDMCAFLPVDGSQDAASDRLEAVVLGWLCNEYGHEIENDQCMRPEHRYCVWCGQRESDLPAGSVS